MRAARSFISCAIVAIAALATPFAGGSALASPSNGAVIQPGLVQFDVPAGGYWSSVWDSRIVVTRGASFDYLSAWGPTWAYLDYASLEATIDAIAADYCGRGACNSGARVQAEIDARYNFYSASRNADFAGMMWGPNASRQMAYGSSTDVLISEPGTYWWQLSYVTGNSDTDNGAQAYTEPKSFSVPAPPQQPTAATVLPAPPPSPPRTVAPVAARPANCQVQQAALARLTLKLRRINQKIARTRSPGLKKGLIKQRVKVRAARSRAAAALAVCQRS